MNTAYFLLLCLFSGTLATASIAENHNSASRVESRTDITNDKFLENMANRLSKNDIILAVIGYKYVQTDTGSICYGRVVQSLRGDIPVEALVRWPSRNKLPAGSAPKTELFSTCELEYVIASSKTLTKLPKATEDFQPANNVYDDGNLIASYDLGDSASYFPMTESDSGRAVKKLLHIEPAKITKEAEAARFREEEEK